MSEASIGSRAGARARAAASEPHHTARARRALKNTAPPSPGQRGHAAGPLPTRPMDYTPRGVTLLPVDVRPAQSLADRTDRFGNPFADGLPYARGEILRGTADDSSKLRAWRHVERHHRAGRLYDFTGLERSLVLGETDTDPADEGKAGIETVGVASSEGCRRVRLG